MRLKRKRAIEDPPTSRRKPLVKHEERSAVDVVPKNLAREMFALMDMEGSWQTE